MPCNGIAANAQRLAQHHRCRCRRCERDDGYAACRGLTRKGCQHCGRLGCPGITLHGSDPIAAGQKLLGSSALIRIPCIALALGPARSNCYRLRRRQWRRDRRERATSDALCSEQSGFSFDVLARGKACKFCSATVDKGAVGEIALPHRCVDRGPNLGIADLTQSGASGFFVQRRD